MESGPQYDLFQQVVDTKNTEVSWCTIKVDGRKLADSGNVGLGLASLVTELNNNKDQVVFAALQVNGVDERDTVTATRPKYIQINWVGPNVAAMKRLGALQLKNEISQVFVGVAATVDCNDADDLTTVELGRVLLKSGGAHKPTYYDFGNGETIQLTALSNDIN